MPSLPRTLSPDSPSSSVDSIALFPRPLTFRRTITSPPPLVSPTPLGRHVPNVAYARNSLRHEFVDPRPMTRGKSARAKQHARMSNPFCLAGKQATISRMGSTSVYQHIEGNPFTDRVGLARLGGNRRRSSIASFSTLKIPKSFRPNISRGGSSIYSRDTKGISTLPNPGLASELSASSQSVPELSPRRVTSFDETIFKGLDWTPQDVDSRLEVSPALDSEKAHSSKALVPQTPTFGDGKSKKETPKVGTASSTTFGAHMPVPKISLARSSDDVFGEGPPPPPTRSNDIVIEDGRVFHRVRAMESKLSQEDLAKYRGRSAPGGVEWF